MKKAIIGSVGLLVCAGAGGAGIYLLRSYLVSALLFYLALIAIFVVVLLLVAIGYYCWCQFTEGLREVRESKQISVPAPIDVVPMGK